MGSIKCKRCRRPLTQKVSIARGYGPLCYKIIQGIPLRESSSKESVIHRQEFVPKKTLNEIYGIDVRRYLGVD